MKLILKCFFTYFFFLFTTTALELTPCDSKALFRRCQAREKLENYGESFKDAKLALHYDTNNKVLKQTLQRLSAIIQQKV